MSHSDSPAEKSTTLRPPRSRLTLRTMFLYLTLCAIFFGAWKLDGMTWVEALRVVATLLVLIGLSEQVRDLYAHFRQAIAPARGLLGWQMAWRIGLGACLLFLAIEASLQKMFPPWFEVTELGWMTGHVPVTGWQFCLIVLLLAERNPVARATSWLARLSGVIALLGALWICYFKVHDLVTIPFLVAVAVRGVMAGQRTRLNGQVIYEYRSEEELWSQLHLGSQFAVPLLIATIIGGWLVITSRPSATRAVAAKIVIGMLASLAALNAWAQYRLWSRPFMFVNSDLQNPLVLGGLLLIAFVAVTALTGLLLRETAGAPSASAWIAWRRPAGRYLHERLISLLVILAVGIEPIVSYFWDYYHTQFPFTSPNLGEALTSLIYDHKAILAILLTLVLLAQLLRSIFFPIEPQPLEVRPLPWLSTLGLWLVVALLLASTLSTLVWLSWVDWMTNY
jgi:hypothetical protein